MSENFLKFILLALMIIATFIPPISSNNSLISWEYILPLNYLRAIIFIIGCAFLPGSNLYSLFFQNDEISKKFSIEPFFLKVTLYPLISFGFIGVSVMILDQIGLSRELISILLVFIILILFFVDIIFQIIRFKHLKIIKIKIAISKNTLFIILFALAVLTISIGFTYGWNYLPPGDPWDGIKYANLIGIKGISPLYIDYYPNFWGYFSFGISALTGLPYINANTLLAPFNYLFVCSVFLFMKSIIFNSKKQYDILSTIFVVLFSGLFLNPLISRLIFDSEFHFIYKSFSYFLFFISIALFFIVINNKNISNFEIRKFWKTSDFKFIILASFLLILSFMTYAFPLLIGLVFFIIYSIFSEKREKAYIFRILLVFVFSIISFFVFFDILLNFYLSYMILRFFPYFFNPGLLSFLDRIKSPYIITYPVFLVLFLILYFLYLIGFKASKKREKTEQKNNILFILIFKIFLLLFITFLIIEIFITFIEQFILNVNLANESFFFLYLDKFYLNLGFIGILGILFSYYCYKKSKSLFLSLISWIIFSFLLAFSLIFMENIKNYPIPPKEIPEENIFMMDYWFNRIWFYSIPALCIFTSIGIFELLNKLKTYRLSQKYKFLYPILKNIMAISIILFSFSGVIISGLINGSTRFRYSKSAITTLNWISENIPVRSGVLVGDNFFMGVGTDSITFVRQYFFYDIFEEEFNETQCIQQIEYLKSERIQYVLISQFFISYYLNKSDFTNNILLPKFYNITLFNITYNYFGDLSVYYAPYFD
ncbi:MAG: hypothetical protein ACFE91_08665 [Promethearchaeota archaeon]